MAALLLGACGGPPTPATIPVDPAPWGSELTERAEALAASLTEAPPAPPGELRVRLAFEAEVDLDLFVTDPLEESVYFANDRSRSGGALDADARCETPAPHFETVRWETPPKGRYRIGVDFPRRCSGGGRAPFAIAVERDGTRTLHRGVIDAGIFLPIVDRFDLR